MLQTSGIAFEEFVRELLERLGYTLTSDFRNRHYDMIASSPSSKFAIDVKYSKQSYMPANMVLNAIAVLNSCAKTSTEKTKHVLIVSGFVSRLSPVLTDLNSYDVDLLDIGNILFLVRDYPDLNKKLLDILEFSTFGIVPYSPNVLLPVLTETSRNVTSVTSENIQSLITELKSWSNKLNPKNLNVKEHRKAIHEKNVQYEQLCIRALKELFFDDLSLWKEQQFSNNNLYRFDLVCRIKDRVDGIDAGLWHFFEKFFNTKYIVFEFKNYAKKITQSEIYTTEKYLYTKALRSVAIIISCKGEDLNAQKAIKGLLRETGKVILSINNDDLIKMLEIKLSDEIRQPSDYLSEKLDEMLIELEK